jgi:serine/threonine-protein kinase
MGRVTLANDAVLGRSIAVKQLHAQHSQNPRLRHRLLREAFLHGRLEHPAIVPVYDVVMDGQDGPHIVMKRVVGDTLESILDQLRSAEDTLSRRYNRRRLLSAYVQVCHAVHYAHTRGIVHRDLKPSNIMMGEFGEVYVMDWGIAKVMAQQEMSPVDEVDLPAWVHGCLDETNEGTVLGTLGYMAPEQASGHGDDQGPCTDVYSLGAILFELVTLEKLHAGTTVKELLKSTLGGVSASLAIRAPDRDLPSKLEALWLQALATAPRDRRINARQLAEGVEAYLDGDRDIERTRERARSLALEAAKSTNEDLGTDHEQRKEALNRSAQALALDPSQPIATEAIERILQHPLSVIPPEVEDNLNSFQQALLRRILLFSGVGQIVDAGLVTLANASVETHWSSHERHLLHLLLSTMVVAGLASIAQSFRRAVDDLGVLVPMVLTGLAIFLTGQVDNCYSPLALVYASGAAMLAIIGSGSKRMGLALAFSITVVGISVFRPVLELLHVVPPTAWIGADHQTLTLHLNFGLASTEQLHYLLIPTFLSVGLYITVLAFGLTKVFLWQRRRTMSLTWQLEQLLPSAARKATSSRPSSQGIRAKLWSIL